MPYLNIVILAGGLGKRMQSDLPKVLHCVQETPMIVKLLTQVIKLNPSQILIVVGKYKDIIQETINQYIQNDKIQYVIQEPALGTGDGGFDRHLPTGRHRPLPRHKPRLTTVVR